jgi:hypothetical protein
VLATGCAEEEGEDTGATSSETAGTDGDMSGSTGMMDSDTGGGEDTSGNDSPDTAGTGDDGGMGDETWSALFSEVIAPNCDNGYCHGGGIGGLAITDAASTYAALVEVAAMGMACGPTGAVRVVPGDPDGSLIVQKIEGTQSCGAAMPKDLPSLSQADIDRVRAWILDGAMDN